MSKFIYISDTHLGTEEMGYSQQQGYPKKLPEILATLNQWIEKQGDIQFVLHGGDMIDSFKKEHLFLANEHFNFCVPVYLCLGNHDLTEKTSLEDWLNLAPQFFLNNSPEFTIEFDEGFIHVMPNQWEKNNPFYWNDVQEPQFYKEQLINLDNKLNIEPDKTHFISTHSSVAGMPTAQSGMPDLLHQPTSLYQKQIYEMINKYPQIDCFLSGHNHMNLNIEMNNVNHITVSSLTETPFEFKVFEITSEKISMRTHNLINDLDFDAQYNFNKTHVQGRSIDRQFVKNL